MPIETERQAGTRLRKERQLAAMKKMEEMNAEIEKANIRMKKQEADDKREKEKRKDEDKKDKHKKYLKQKQLQKKTGFKSAAGRKGINLEDRKKMDRAKAAKKKKKSEFDGFIVPEDEFEESEEDLESEAEAEKRKNKKKEKAVKALVEKKRVDSYGKTTNVSDDLDDADGEIDYSKHLKADGVDRLFGKISCRVNVVFPTKPRSSLSSDTLEGESSSRSIERRKKRKKKKKEKESKVKEHNKNNDGIIDNDKSNDENLFTSSDEDEPKASILDGKSENEKKSDYHKIDPVSQIDTKSKMEVVFEGKSKNVSSNIPDIDGDEKPYNDSMKLKRKILNNEGTNQKHPDFELSANNSEITNERNFQKEQVKRSSTNEDFLQSIKRKMLVKKPIEKRPIKIEAIKIEKEEIKRKASKIPKKNSKKVTAPLFHSMNSLSISIKKEQPSTNADIKNEGVTSLTIPLSSQKKRANQFPSSTNIISPRIDVKQSQEASNASIVKPEIVKSEEAPKPRLISVHIEKKLRESIIRGLGEELGKVFGKRAWKERKKNVFESSTQGINWSGSFCITPENRYDFFDRDENDNVVFQPEIPIFPEDFPDGKPTHPLRWWGIEDPPKHLIEAAKSELLAEQEQKKVEVEQKKLEHERKKAEQERKKVEQEQKTAEQDRNKIMQQQIIEQPPPLTRPPPPVSIPNMQPPPPHSQNAPHHSLPRQSLPPPRSGPPPPQHFQNPPPSNHQLPPPNHPHQINNHNRGNWNGSGNGGGGPPGVFNCPPPGVTGSNSWSQGPPPHHPPGAGGGGNIFHNRKPPPFQQQQGGNNFQGQQQQNNRGW
eukprot:CAMPEP_0194366098 /NCGR_PEP_ID=MMETSP0174-20130528/14099_1 /TAXON_ID=216777 /ORGANISM="Proboscia alata, Strain PI-D3" /LENGTH=824 /DNA_ID=CAMNT_0039141085 /DNA_START=41 /DNA_END=2516 /DNA_ORIENTATION=-